MGRAYQLSTGSAAPVHLSRERPLSSVRLEQHRNHENEPSQDGLIVGAKQRRQIPHRTKIGLDCTPIFKSARTFVSTVNLSARLLRLACRRSSFAARSLEIGDVLKVMARIERRWGGLKMCTSFARRLCSPRARTSALVGG
jgi:hypothetical protein